MEELIVAYKKLLNTTLPTAYTKPVRFNHCFNRIILDWLYSDCWYHHLSRKQTAVSQLNEVQLQSAIARMKEWLNDKDLLIADNNSSLNYRSRRRSNGR